MTFSERAHLVLAGLRPASAQAFGAVRLVPLLREQVRADLRLGARAVEAPTLVGLRGEAHAPQLVYYSYVPHAFVLRWTSEGSPVAARGASLEDPRRPPNKRNCVELMHRMRKREAPDALRILPLHLALEGYLSLHFGGPDVAWREYSREALRSGLSPRIEQAASGAMIAGLDDALRTFEVHEGQTGCLVFVADALAAVFVVPHPDDYRALHRSLIHDFFGDLIYQYALCYAEVQEHVVRVDAAAVTDLAGLRAAIARGRADWREFTAAMASGVLAAPMRWEEVYRAGPFRLRRFLSSLHPDEENHIGEAIVRDSGELEYCKTFRLSAAQARRAYLLERLAAADWDLRAAAAALACSRDDLLVRLRNAGFGYLLKEHVLKGLPG